MGIILNQINFPEDLRNLSLQDLIILSEEIRDLILDTLSVKPGHLGAGMGIVELAAALHYFYNTPEDQLVWDVGHQSYPHKILTGRKNDFGTLRQMGGISGFPFREESEYDTFGTGHSSTSISAAMGMAISDRLKGLNNRHIAIIGDASIASGMAMEALNHLGSTDLDVLVILNDNSIGIDPSVGALKEHFFELRNEKAHSVFEDFGLHYKGVIDGHDFEELFKAFEELEEIKGPKLLHIKTIKGKGYASAEEDQVKWHSPGTFDKTTGEISKKKDEIISYQQIFGEALAEIMEGNNSLTAITPAMLSGSHMHEAKEKFPERVFDVGIAEQHAVTLAAGMATRGIVPYCVLYSTFLQRAYDQLIHDVALQNLPVVFCVDRAGIVGTDGPTHHGVFDIAFMRSVPNMIISEPMTLSDFRNLLYTAQFTESPFSIRFPRGGTGEKEYSKEFKKLSIGKAEELKKGSETAILSFGTLGYRIEEILKNIPEKEKFGHYKFLFCKPLDKEILGMIFEQYSNVVTVESGVLNGGFGDAVLEYASERNFKGKVYRKGYPDEFLTHASVSELEKQIGLDEESLEKFLVELK